MKYAHKSHIGKRIHNEDSCFVPPKECTYPLVAVSDGMGGHAAGAVASKLIIDGVSEEFAAARDEDVVSQLKRTIQRVNLDVYRTAQDSENLKGMGATLVCAVLSPTRFVAANVGDSRLYHFGQNEFHFITTDHSYVQMLVDEGAITPEQARTHPQRNLITRAMGIGLRADIDIYDRAWHEGDILLLCSDGLHGSVEKDELIAVLSNDTSLENMCDQLVSLALDNGATDNITVVLARNEGGDCA